MEPKYACLFLAETSGEDKTSHGMAWHGMAYNIWTLPMRRDIHQRKHKKTIKTHILSIMMYSPFAEKSPLLPVAEPAHETTKDQRRYARIECALLVATLILTALQFLIINSADGCIPIVPNGHCSAIVAQLAGGLRTSILASLPTAAVLFIIVPFLAQKEHVVVARYTILFWHLVGSTLGALLL